MTVVIDIGVLSVAGWCRPWGGGGGKGLSSMIGLYYRLSI